jgi:serine protease AprX
MKGKRRALGSVLAALVAALACAAPAGAAAPPLQIGSLGSGTAILSYDGGRARDVSTFDRALRGAGVRTVFFQRQRLVGVRGTAIELRRAARLPGVQAAHMNAPIKLLLHESVPLIYGGSPDATWASGIDGRGGSVAVVDSGVDGTHPDLAARMAANVKVLDPGDIFDTGQPVYLECPVSCSTDTTGGHGTHVAGIVAADGTASNGYYRGVAPGTKLVGLGVGEGPSVLYAIGAFEWILANHQKYGIVAVNNSWGTSGDDGRFDATDPVNVGTKALSDAGLTVVFAAGNDGPGTRTDPAGASDCSTQPAPGGGREATTGVCKMNPYSVAPWTLSIANGRKDEPGGAGGQHLNFSSSRGDPTPEQSLDGQTIDYEPTLTAPGTNIRSTRMLAGVNTTAVESCLSAEAPACAPPPGAAQYEPFYMPLTGTSMSSPHVAGAVAVIQSKAQAALGRRLTPAEVRSVLVDSATPMTGVDGLWDWPCGSSPVFVDCGAKVDGTTGKPYERWQVGAGYLNVTGALDRVAAIGAAAPASSGPVATGQAPAALPTTPPPGASADPVRTTLPPTTSDRRAQARRRAALKRCRTKASHKKTHRARVKARKQCKARYG